MHRQVTVGLMNIWGGTSALFWMIFLLILERDREYVPPTELIHRLLPQGAVSLLSLY